MKDPSIKEVKAEEVIDCIKEELGVDITLGEIDPSLTFQKLFGFTIHAEED